MIHCLENALTFPKVTGILTILDKVWIVSTLSDQKIHIIRQIIIVLFPIIMECSIEVIYLINFLLDFYTESFI